MKKLAYFCVLCLLLTLFCVGLTGCSGSNPDELTGKYYAYEYNYDTDRYEINYDYYIQIDTDSKGSVFYDDTGYDINFTISDYKIKFEDFSVGWNMSKGAIRDGILRIGQYTMIEDYPHYFCKKGTVALRKYDNLLYTIGLDGNYEVAKPTNEYIKRATIKSKINGIPVTTIAMESFLYCRNLEHVTIPDSITTIEEAAFIGCSELKNLKFPKTIKSIGSGAFQCCSSLTELNLPNIESIESGTFLECTSLTSVTIPNTVKSIDSEAFFGCSSLKEIYIPESVTYIKNGSAFASCNLESLSVSPLNSAYHSDGNCIIETETKTLVAGCKTSVIPTDDNIASIGDWAFFKCDISELAIPETVHTIGTYAFAYCNNITSVILPNGVVNINWGVFNNCTNLSKITIPDSVTYLGYVSLRGCGKLTVINYEGTIDQWNSISKDEFGYSWDEGTGDYKIHCTDGDILKDGTIIKGE